MSFVTSLPLCPSTSLRINVSRSMKLFRSARSQARCAPPGQLPLTSITFCFERAMDDGAIPGAAQNPFATLTSFAHGLQIQGQFFKNFEPTKKILFC